MLGGWIEMGWAAEDGVETLEDVDENSRPGTEIFMCVNVVEVEEIGIAISN